CTQRPAFCPYTTRFRSDDGINTQVPELAGANIDVKGRWCVDFESGEAQPAESTDLEISEHGTSVVSMIVGNGAAADGGTGARGRSEEHTSELQSRFDLV